ncbi:MAG: hypothetical protein E7353_03245 [Clostridiales bacterium]|nr:hypothetical protein [Clostridiales bacterium]
MKKIIDRIVAIFKKAWEYLKDPPTLVKVLSFISALLCVGGAMAVIIIGYQGNIALEILAYTLFGLSAITFSYCVYFIVRWIPSAKRKIMDMIDSNRFTHTLRKDYGFRTVIFAIGSFTMSIAFSAFNGYMGIAFASIFNGALAMYYIVLALVRGGVLFHHGKGAKKDDTYHEKDDERRAKIYRNIGILILILSVALSAIIAQMIFDDRHFSYPGWTVFAFAAYAFFKITMSIINLFKARKHDDMTVRAIRNINLTDAMVSIIALQTALLHTFGTEGIDISLYNTLTGCVVSGGTYAIGIIMIVVGVKTLKILKSEKNNE